MTIGTRKASMGLFNLKKSKNDTEDDFEASDEWLMGLSGGSTDQLSSGPNASIPDELQTLAPPVGFEPDPIAEIGQAAEPSVAGWHLPDLVAADVDDNQAPAPPPPPPPGLLFADGHPGAPATEPFPLDETIAEPATADTEASSGFGSHFFFDEPQEHEHDTLAKPLDTGVPPYPTLGSSVPEAPVFNASRLDPPLLEDESLIEDAVLDHAGLDNDDFGGGGPSATTPQGPEADMLREILGVDTDASWTDLRAAHARAITEHDPDLEIDEDRVALARAIRRELNSAYATLRLLAAR